MAMEPEDSLDEEAARIQASLDAAENIAMQKINLHLRRGIHTDSDVAEFMTAVTAVVTKRSTTMLLPAFQHSAERLVRDLIPHIHGASGPFHLTGARLTGRKGPWARATDGTIWLEGGDVFALEFVTNSTLSFKFSPESPEEESIRVDAQEKGAIVTFALQTSPRFATFSISVGRNMEVGKELAVLLQFGINPITISGAKPMLQLSYNVFWREQDAAQNS